MKDHTRRRGFLAGAAGLTFGIAAGLGVSRAAPESSDDTKRPYVELDPQEIRISAHECCYASNCSSGVFKTIMSRLAEEVGEPYSCIPLDLFAFGGGGVCGWGTVCGSLNGAGSVISIVTGPGYNSAVMNELMGWYTLQPFPTDESNALAVSGGFRGDRAVSGIALDQSVSESTLCHVSVGTWCTASGKASMSPERKERCARVTADVAAKTVELLNACHAGTFEAAYETPEDIRHCTACHKPGTVASAGQTTLGKLNCMSCHDSHF